MEKTEDGKEMSEEKTATGAELIFQLSEASSKERPLTALKEAAYLMHRIRDQIHAAKNATDSGEAGDFIRGADMFANQWLTKHEEWLQVWLKEIQRTNS